eukprot:CAMPEP_0119004512 /NCGR_PEP_ID=MMETSP1176-20130426/1182_1 /TAXON_ID=265551 /ORGANISM="Synedropsis recta cf, Strain CCMP1620" /LENGTH=446 /DNA_ID=CAMNT_0006956223 /DNA_START=153 /DNA_END=1490 /DNA_ORIENTATION=-
MSYVPYQLDYQVTGKGKTLGVTKKKITWKFGFANDEALAGGMSGPNCRGSEHEVVFIWSLKSGKRQIAVDGKEVHFSESGMNGWTADRTFQHHFNLYNPNYGSIRCHLITLPPNHDAPGGNRPFQLRVNGVNYFDFSMIFQLGTPAMVVRPAPAGGSGGGGSSSNRGGPDNDPYMSHDERQAIARAKLESMRDIRKVNSKDGGEIASPPRVQESSLISFDDPPPQGVQTSRGRSHMMSSMTMGTTGGSFDSYPPQNPAPAPPAAAAAAAAPYSNYALPPAPAPPAYQQQQQPPPAPVYGGAPPPAAASAYGAPPPAFQQQPAAPAYNAPYGAPPVPAPYAQAPQGYGFAQAPPAPAAAPAFAQAPAYGGGGAPAWGSPPPAPGYSQAGYAQQHPGLSIQTATAPSPGGQAYGASNTPNSYGSAPSFAQPPQQQQQAPPAFTSPPQQ